MTHKQHARIGKQLRALADELGLRDWFLILEHEPTKHEDALASIRCIYGRKCAVISLARDFNDQTKQEQEKCLIHELIHCHLEGIAVVVRAEALKQIAGMPAYSLLLEHVADATEWAVDAIAHEVARIIWERK